MSISRRFSVSFKKPTLTKSYFKDEVNINNILAKYQSSGQLPAINPRTPQFIDVTNIPDFTSSLNTITSFQQLFDGLPAKFRKSLNNDLGAFLDYLQDSKNSDTLKSLGISADLIPTSPVGEATPLSESSTGEPLNESESSTSE